MIRIYKNHNGTVTPVGTLWTSDIPDDRNNAASTSATLPITDLDAGDSIIAYGGVRSDETATANNGGHIGGAITPVDLSGNFIGANQTPAATAGDERETTATVRVPQFSTGSNDPTNVTGAVITSVPIPATPVDGTVIASGAFQAFDFYPTS